MSRRVGQIAVLHRAAHHVFDAVRLKLLSRAVILENEIVSGGALLITVLIELLHIARVAPEPQIMNKTTICAAIPLAIDIRLKKIRRIS